LLVRLSQDNGAASSQTSALVYATVNAARCISARHLFESILVAVTSALRAWNGSGGDENLPQRCETLAQLAASLGFIFEELRLKDHSTHFVLVLDGMDKQRDPPLTLLPALARLCETVSWACFESLEGCCMKENADKMLIDFVPHVCFYCYNSAGWVSPSLSDFVSLLPPVQQA
jgi:hypothetical protein